MGMIEIAKDFWLERPKPHPRHFVQRVRKWLTQRKLFFALLKESERVKVFRNRRCGGAQSCYPYPPGNWDDYQKKEVAGEAICMNVKRKDL